VEAIAANRDPAILRSAGCIEGNGATLRRFRTCDDRAWRDRSAAEVRDRVHPDRRLTATKRTLRELAKVIRDRGDDPHALLNDERSIAHRSK
jgi:hypothetical protein